MSKPTTIVALEAQNVKRLKAVSIRPDGAHVVTVCGRNGHIILETQELKVTRRFSAGGSTLQVQNKEGANLSSPQAVLDKLCATLAFDPLSFVRADREAQTKQLRELVGVYTTVIEAEIKKHFDNRTEVNRQAKAQEAVVGSLPSDGPAAVDVAFLMQELNEAEAVNAAARGLEQESDRQAARVEKGVALLQKANADIARLETELYGAKSYKEAIANQLHECRGLAEGAAAKAKAIKEKIAGAARNNELAARVTRRNEEAKKLRTLEKASEALTETIDELRERKEKMIAGAKFPVPGLGFDGDGITFNNVPFDQASSAEQLRVGLSIACELNPALRVMLIRDGSLLDAESLALVAEIAKSHGAQVWVERVGRDGRCSVIIEDGSAVEPEGDA